MTIKQCLTCGKEINVTDNLTQRKKFCSYQCKYLGTSLGLIPSKTKKGINITCPICHKSFYIIKCHIGKKIYCSKKCYNLAMKGKRFSPKTEFKKGQKSWNKGTKGKILPNSGSYKPGVLNRNFKGEIKHKGYILAYSPNHPFRDSHNYVKRSRLTMEKHLGRFLEPQEVVHHINHIRDDDRIENLMLFSDESAHSKLHYPKGQKPKYFRNKYEHSPNCQS
jgi:endogenous inhibitor of DNA gyrase (YacG/DUF329 family)